MDSKRGNREAQYELAGIYEAGLGTPQNFREAIIWYQKAAENGFSHAQCPLGELHLKLQNPVAAHMWFNLAAATSECLENVAESRDEITKALTPDQLAQAQDLVTKWAEQHKR